MYIPANLSFNLHAHPNIEIIWVLSGTIHEYRLVNNTNPTDFVQVRFQSLVHHIITYLSYLLLNPQQYLAEREDKTSPSIKGPNLANVSDLQFVYNSVSAIPETELTPEISMERLRSAFIINEIGSIHLSFTRDEETILLVVWSGGHANVPKDEYPSHAKDLFPLVTKDDSHQ